MWAWTLGQAEPRLVDNVIEYQAEDLDPDDLEGAPEESNPFGIEALADGSALVVDAAGNDLLRAHVTEGLSTVARFPVEVVATDHLPEPMRAELPPELPTESVPTTVAVGPDGAYYVGEVKGFPFRPGSSRIWRVAAGSEGVDCSLTASGTDACRTAETGYTAIADLDIAPTGDKLVIEYAEDGILAFEGGFESGEFPPAVLKVSHRGKVIEVLRGELSQPGRVAIGRGKVFALDGFVTGGRLVRLL